MSTREQILQQLRVGYIFQNGEELFQLERNMHDVMYWPLNRTNSRTVENHNHNQIKRVS